MKLISGPVARLLLSIASTSYPFEGNLEKRKKKWKKKGNTEHPFTVQFRRLFFDTLVHAIRRGSRLAKSVHSPTKELKDARKRERERERANECERGSERERIDAIVKHVTTVNESWDEMCVTVLFFFLFARTLSIILKEEKENDKKIL